MIRSRAVSPHDAASPPAKQELAESNKARMAESASLLSEIPRAAAMEVNRFFSSAVGRAVIDGRVRLSLTSFMTRHRAAERDYCDGLALSVLELGRRQDSELSAMCSTTHACSMRRKRAIESRLQPETDLEMRDRTDATTAHFDTDSDTA